ncbi:cell division protein FtsL [Clostridium aminobutyricum]|uniref:Cell division protein FtsL n=1 Tax=Clostridium aminobutyricum TaxID=33953 RepID=A0A939IHV3_CLOAM|nr:cell division protein FtsL [Clostridium aminobutyricum]MBN7774252.1 cell division protein FtsL [Clostridium aminobutyricum]
MMPAEQWYEYQDNYKKYGFDMKPKKVVIIKQKKKSVVTKRDRLAMLFLTIVIGAVCVSMIITTAYASSIKYQINNIIKENAVITGELENLTVQINEANNIQAIEQKATTQLGMVNPDPNQFVYLNKTEKPTKDFALLLMEEAYN